MSLYINMINRPTQLTGEFRTRYKRVQQRIYRGLWLVYKTTVSHLVNPN